MHAPFVVNNLLKNIMKIISSGLVLFHYVKFAILKLTWECDATPYIKEEDRNEMQDAYETLKKQIRARGSITGVLNYLLFKLAKDYCTCYEDYRDFIGELEAAKLEIYRRLAAPYEDEKIKENGDVK